VYAFPPLQKCRERFAQEMQQDIAWGAEAEWTHEEVQVEDDEVPF